MLPQEWGSPGLVHWQYLPELRSFAHGDMATGFAAQNGSAGQWGAELKALRLNGLSGWLPMPLPVGVVTALSAETAGVAAVSCEQSPRAGDRVMVLGSGASCTQGFSSHLIHLDKPEGVCELLTQKLVSKEGGIYSESR